MRIALCTFKATYPTLAPTTREYPLLALGHSLSNTGHSIQLVGHPPPNPSGLPAGCGPRPACLPAELGVAGDEVAAAAALGVVAGPRAAASSTAAAVAAASSAAAAGLAARTAAARCAAEATRCLAACAARAAACMASCTSAWDSQERRGPGQHVRTLTRWSNGFLVRTSLIYTDAAAVALPSCVPSFVHLS